MTALYDAIGHTMRLTDDFVALHKPDQVLFVIMTDGEENSSREFTRERIFQMIQDRQSSPSTSSSTWAPTRTPTRWPRHGAARRSHADYAATPEGARDDDEARVPQRAAAPPARREDARPSGSRLALEADGALEAEEWARKKQADGA